MNWNKLSEQILKGEPINREQAMAVLQSTDNELLEVINAAYQLRKKYFGNTVALHLLRNVKSGLCPEDCSFCSQSTSAKNDVAQYEIQTVEDIVAGAQAAVDRQAKRYCVVASSRSPSPKELRHICEAAVQIKQQHPDLEICSSLGILTEEKAIKLKEAGVDRFNHNIETSERYYAEIVSTHKYSDRTDTARIVKKVGLELCCGGIFGMGETLEDRIELAFALAELEPDSVPLNFLDPRPGTSYAGTENPLTPNDCLRGLALFRMALPKAEIRIGAGRETTLRTVQPLALYMANSMFTSGYLTTDGQDFETDKRMIEDAGFEIETQAVA